ncbi:MAG TPA: hypothetical protein VGQ24_04880, partial [Gemmatimonadales bacterium]|nr:hypothetical protein [Gemmatimonadales bacterium]
MRLPPAILLVLIFEAGLATGLSRFPAPELVVLSLGCAALVLHRRRLAWLPAAAAIGFTLGSVARSAAHDSCAARLPAAELRLTA